MWEEVAQGGVIDLYSGMREYDALIPEGGRGMLRLNLRLPVSQNVADQVESALVAAGVPDVKVTTSSPVLRIYFRKGFAWLPVIVGVIIPLLVVLAIVIIGWQLYKQAGPVAASLTLIVAGVIAVSVAATLLLRKVT
jgi:hypothetical protein